MCFVVISAHYVGIVIGITVEITILGIVIGITVEITILGIIVTVTVIILAVLSAIEILLQLLKKILIRRTVEIII
jgi:hypothetical protein